jgi:hypothetical protein
MHYGGGVGRRKAKPQPCLIPDSLAASTPLQISNGLNQAPMGTRYHFPAFLTGSCLRTEMAVTHSKQTTGTFLTGSRIARKRSRNNALFRQSSLLASLQDAARLC